jgi:predicted RecB family nuclease
MVRESMVTSLGIRAGFVWYLADMKGLDQKAGQAPSDASGARRITASHLYDFAVCEHRVALDFTLDRSRRTPPDEALSLLTKRGRDVEHAIASGLGYELVEPDPSDPAAAHAKTLDLMRQGVRGIYQGVLLHGDHLAIPDLMRREPGPSEFGDFHYAAGDIKSGLEPRTDQVLQVVFAARLLERIQGRRPATGFLLMGDGAETVFETEDVWDSAGIAVETLERIAGGERDTFPALNDGCARCRWRGICLPEMAKGPDLSFVAGLTRTRQRILMREGLRTVADVAALRSTKIRALESRGIATDGLVTLRKQAGAILKGRVLSRARRRIDPLSPDGLREHFIFAAHDPLSGGEPFLFGYASRPEEGAAADRTEILLAGNDAERAGVLRFLLAWFGEREDRIFHFGETARRCFERLEDLASLDPAQAGRCEARFVDLAPLVRNGAYFPVRRYRFEEIANVIARQPLPSLEEPEDAPFVWFENHRSDPAGDWKGRIEERARHDLARLIAVRDWVRRHVEQP